MCKAACHPRRSSRCPRTRQPEALSNETSGSFRAPQHLSGLILRNKRLILCQSSKLITSLLRPDTFSYPCIITWSRLLCLHKLEFEANADVVANPRVSSIAVYHDPNVDVLQKDMDNSI